ncbi:hypothetical protein RISK_004041 [Rhodopirellula islandica]|uniref:Uncharacterized protein n=1 Tax=Rhodopirellula islandica TaxID=595434 RepID=A0A0J1EDK5_RHOIS|nr:hypothetical protein RISK_004041 [Rhodopirellula islandica]
MTTVSFSMDGGVCVRPPLASLDPPARRVNWFFGWTLPFRPVPFGLVEFVLGWPFLADIQNSDGQECPSQRDA